MASSKATLNLGVSGDVGSFSEQAALIYLTRRGLHENDYRMHYLIDMNGALDALFKKVVDLAILPFVNHSSGIVMSAFEAMGRYAFSPLEEILLHVKQNLLVKDRTIALTDLQMVYSYSPALLQCQQFLRQHNLQFANWSDTAKAARDLATNALPHDATCVGVIASMQAATAYNLHVLASDIADAKPNITRFVVLSR